jgi:hypothetical protein
VPANLINFSLVSKRVVWWDFGEGAAVLWDPSFYHKWQKRKDDITVADTLSKQLLYACLNHINYVVVDLRPKVLVDDARILVNPSPSDEMVYHNKWFSVYKANCSFPIK